MARQKKRKKSIKDDQTGGIIKKQFRGLQMLAVLMFLIFLGLNVGAFYLYFGRLQGLEVSEYMVGLVISSTSIILFGLIVILAINARQNKTRKLVAQVSEDEMNQLRASAKRAEALQEMASVMRTTLNFEKVVEASIDACAAAMEELGIPRKSVVVGVLTYQDNRLYVVSSHRLGEQKNQWVTGQQGALGEALQYAEPVVTNDARNDPELREFSGLRKCQTIICDPLRVGFDLYGVMIIGSEVGIKLGKDDLEMFRAIADQSVIALRNAQLYENLEREKQRLIEAEVEARKQLARALHDGPTQSVAAIAMRINFVRSLLNAEPEAAASELEKVEQLAKDTGKEIRGMLFTLRPLILDEKGLAAAVEEVMQRIHDTDGLNMRLLGGEAGDLLNQRAQTTVFYIIEEALGNARKYSRAKMVEVRMWQEENLFVARIQDDGVGFDVNDVMDGYSERGSLGMVNIQERATMVDGSVQIESAVGQGTAITLVVPLDKHGAHV